MVLFLAVASVQGQGSKQPHRGRETWYEFVVRQFNPHNFDYGAWIEKRRRALLDATAKTPYFWYSFGATSALLLLILAYAKLYMDHRRSMWITTEMMADVYNHDLYSRKAAREAIEKYNKHIEQCNRAIEAAESGDGRPGWGETQVDSLKAELQRAAAQLEATTQDRSKLQEELRQKSLVVADLSMRVDALSKKVNGPGSSGGGPREPLSADATGDGARFVGHINQLQEELYAERQKNKRLKVA
jgi:hypothetical protein